MTDPQLFQEYLRRETAGHATMRGADCDQIVEDLAQETGRTSADVKDVVLRYTIEQGRG